MPDMRAVITLAVPTVTVLLGLLWYLGRKKAPTQKKRDDPPDKSQHASLQSGSSQNVNSNCQLRKREISATATETAVKVDNNIVSETKVAVSEVKVAAKQAVGNNISRETKPDASGDHAQKAKEIVQETIVRSIEVANSQSSSPSHMEASPKKQSSQKQTIVEEQIMQATKTEQVLSSLPSLSSNSTAKTQNKTSIESQIIVDESIISIGASSNITSDTVSKTNTETSDELNSKLSSEMGNSMSRSWHEDVDEHCDLDKTDTTNAILTNSNDDGHSSLGASSSTKSGASVSENGYSKTRSPKSEKNNRNASCQNKLSLSPKRSPPKSKEPSQERTNKNGEEVQNGSDASSNCDNLSEASNDSGKGGSVHENLQQNTTEEDRVYEFNMPSDLCGLFIGTRGKTVKTLRDQSGSKIRLRNNPYTPDFQICVIEGQQSAIERACNLIRQKFPSIKYPGMDPMTPISNPVIVPEIMQMSLPEGVSVDIVVSSIVDAGRLFIQQPTHPTFASLERLNTFMNQCYLTEGAVPDVPRPIESGVICAAPMLNGWYRAQIMAYYENTDECDIKYVDYGGYSRISSQCLKQIRSDFMTLPFEAIECYIANVTMLEHESFFSTEAAVVLEELTQGKLLQAQVVGRAEDGIPYIHIYLLNTMAGSNSPLMVNREMVNRGVVRWVDH